MPAVKVPIGPNGDFTVVLLNKYDMFILLPLEYQCLCSQTVLLEALISEAYSLQTGENKWVWNA